MGLLFQLLSILCFGISNAFWKKIEKSGYGFIEAVFYRSVIAVAMLIVMIATFNHFEIFNEFCFVDQYFFQQWHWLQCIFICVFCSLGLVCFVSSLKQNVVGVAVSLTSVNIFGILCATLFLHEAFEQKHAISLVIATFGILLIGIKKTDKKYAINFRKVMLPFAASFFWGIGYTLFKIPLKWVGPLMMSLFIETTVLLVSFILLLKQQKVTPINLIKSWSSYHFYFSGFLLATGSVFVNIALSSLSIVLINITGLLIFPVSIFMAYLFNHEIPTFKAFVGMALIILSILFVFL